jgi:hypothetical protein
MIKIFDINDKLLMQAEVTSAAKREQEMSKSDYISLSFSAAEKVILPVGAYINYTYKIDKVREVTRKFLLLESYEPTQSDECSWKYTPQFQHPKMILSKTPFFIYTRNSQNVEVKQNVWSFVGTTSVLSGKIANFLNKDLMFGECGWKVIFSNVTANTVNVSFSDNDFISALTAITNAIGDNCEWHIDYDDEIIYIGKVLIGATPVVLEVGKNVGVPSINNSKEGYYNAFSIFGGTRNITQVNSKGENVSSGDIRLQLDEGNGTILIDGKERSYSIDKYSTLDLRADKTKEPLFTKVLDFSQIYPSLNTYVYNVRGRVKYVLDDNNKKIPISYNADGSVKEYKTFTVWYMKLAYPTTEKVEGKTIINTTVDDGVTHYWYDFEVTDDLLINGKNIGCSFEPNFNTGALSTPLAGRGSNGEYVGFELIYHKEASSSHTSDDVSDSNFSVLAGDYEIIYQEDNEVIIPTNEAEMLIPRGESKPSLKCNITVLYNIAMADTIYYEDAQNRLLEKAKEEIVRLLSDLNNYEVKSYSDVFLEDNPQLQIGQSITYKDGHGYELATRVLKLSTNIDYDFIQSITIGNQVIKGTITQLKEDVQTIIASGGSSGNGGGYSVSQLRKLIAKYGSDNFISKQFDDIAKGTITWEKLQKFLKGMKVGANGDWTLDELDNTHLTTDYLQVRMKAIFETLEILHTDTLGGELFITPVGSNRILKVEEVNITYDGVSQKAYRCYFLGEQDGSKVENKWKVGDQARSKSFNLTAGKYHNVGNHYYWRLVIGVSSEAVEIDGKKYHYVDLSDIDKDAASDEPMVDDILNQCGNRTDITRQSCLVFSAVDTYSPCITLYHGVDGYTFNNKEYVDYGVNHSTNKAFFHVYGDMYFGDRPTSANNYEGDSYVKYDSDKKKVTIKGDLDIKSTYDGKTLDKYITEKSLDKNAVETIIKKSKTITDLQNQIDGAIETWFYDGVPTLKTEPASGWDTDMMKNHLGDLYYDNKTGKAYRFAKDGSTYKWIIITDTELTKALEDSSQALKDAKSKRRIFGSQPVPPYDVNDMWVNATYPSDGSTYKNEILKCSTSKAEGEEFDIADWKLASKYTDDTKAEEAKKAAEKAQEEIKNTQTNLITLGTTVSDNKKAFDVFTSDGYLDSSEIAAIAQDSKRLEDDYNAAVESYNNVVGSKFLLDKDGKETTYKTDLVSAKDTLDSAKNELITYLSDIVSRYNASDSNGKATIKAAAAQKYTNFTNAYKAFYDKLGVANNYITSNLFDGLNTKLITNMAGLEYIKAALVDGDTVVKGGLILSTLIALRNDKGNVTAGINGADTKENGIALWLGGKAIDKQASTTTEEEKKIAAKSLLRFDGTGYFANGNLWWDADGTLHADPTSFIINKNNVGVQLALFAPVWKSGTTDTTKLANVLSIDPQKPFTHLDVSGNVTTEGSLKIGGIYLSYDSANNALRLSKDAAGKEAANFYALGGITAYGAGASTTGGGGGLNGSVKSYSNALKLTSESLSEIASAYSIKALDSRISSLEGGSATAISVSGSGNAVTSVTKNGTTISVVKGSTFLTSHQSLDGYVNAISVSGSGNAITSVSKSGKGITFTKGATFLTSHQSLANYYTKSSVDSLLSGKSATSHTHSVIINGTTKIIAASGGTAVNLGTYLTSHQSLADYAKKTDLPSVGNGTIVINQAGSEKGRFTVNQSGTTTINLSDNNSTYNFSGASFVSGNGSTGEHNANNITYNSHTYYTSNGPSTNLGASTNDGSIYSQAYNSTWVSQIAQDYRNGRLFVRGKNNGTWQDWKRIAQYEEIPTSLPANGGNADTVDGVHMDWSTNYTAGNYLAIWDNDGKHIRPIPLGNVSIGNADKLDGIHASGLLTAISNSDKGISITVGGTTKSVSNISVNYASSAGNADTVDGYHESSFLRYRGEYGDASVTKDGVGVYGWAHTNEGHNNFHESYGDIINIQGYSTWRTRFDIGISGRIRIMHGINTTTATQVGYLAYLHDNVASATKLQTPRTIWGQSFDGTGNVNGMFSGTKGMKINGVWIGLNTNSESRTQTIDCDGNDNLYLNYYRAKHVITNHAGGNLGVGTDTPAYKLHVAGDIYSTASIRTIYKDKAIILSDSDDPAWISAIAGQIVFDTGKAIRFGETAWDWNQWAGLKYTHSDKTIYLGIADGSIFNANSPQSDGTLRLAGIKTVTPDSGARIGGSGGNLYLGNANNSGWVCTQDICSQTNSSLWSIRQDGNAYFKNIYSGAATINGNLSVDGLISNKGILPANYEFNNKGTSCYVSADALCSGITAITDSIQVNQVTVQYSNDNGNSWTNYSMGNDAKFNLYASNAGLTQVYLGYNVITGNNDAEKLAQVKKNELIVSFYISASCYTQAYFASVDISKGIDTICTVEILNNSGAVVETFTKHMDGWNQVNYINLSKGNTGYGLGTNNHRYIRFKFKHDQKTTALRNTVINKIRIFSFTKYSFPTDRFMGHTGHIYNFDYNMNTYFPNSILAKGGVTAYQSSDIRLKQDLRKLDYLGIIKAMGGTYGFAWKKDNTRSIGWIAQHVLCNPHLKDIVETDEKGYYKINYWSPKLIATAFGAIEQVGDEVSRLKARVVFLESEVQRLSGDKEDCNKKRLDNKNINSLN